jgi:hypothetical protein
MSEATNADVVDQHARDDRLIQVAVAGVARQQDVLFFSEVTLAFGTPIRQKRIPRGGGRVLVGTP